jgi:hypothetical protein
VPAVAVLLFPEWAKDHKWKAKESEFHAMLDSMKCVRALALEDAARARRAHALDG